MGFFAFSLLRFNKFGFAVLPNASFLNLIRVNCPFNASSEVWRKRCDRSNAGFSSALFMYPKFKVAMLVAAPTASSITTTDQQKLWQMCRGCAVTGSWARRTIWLLRTQRGNCVRSRVYSLLRKDAEHLLGYLSAAFYAAPTCNFGICANHGRAALLTCWFVSSDRHELAPVTQYPLPLPGGRGIFPASMTAVAKQSAYPHAIGSQNCYTRQRHLLPKRWAFAQKPLGDAKWTSTSVHIVIRTGQALSGFSVIIFR